MRMASGRSVELELTPPSPWTVPLLLPSVLDATTNLGQSLSSPHLPPPFQTDTLPLPSITAVGLTNTFQSTSSSFSLQLGSHVYTTNKGFPLPQLPYELRAKIILMALEESRSFVAQPPIPLLLLLPLSPLSL